MVFPFTFSVPSLSNPFSSSSLTTSSNAPARVQRMPIGISAPGVGAASTSRTVPVGSCQPLRAYGQPPPLMSRRQVSPLPVSQSRKRSRGWEPSLSETTTTYAAQASASTAQGYLDTPAKYRDQARGMASTSAGSSTFQATEADHQMVDDIVSDMPPEKKRRTLTGSILSTAVSAAVIGTAVGLTVYRLWRDRGKQPTGDDLATATPPPPYHQGMWVEPIQQQKPAVAVTPPTPRSQRAKRTKVAAGRHTHHHRHHLSSSIRDKTRSISPPQPQEFNFIPHSPSSLAPPSMQAGDAMDEEGDEMDILGSKLASLIEAGKRALGTEVVVMSEAKDDEVDDGHGEWVDEDIEAELRNGSIKRRGSTGSTRRRNIKPAMGEPSTSNVNKGLGIQLPYSSGQGMASLTSLHSVYGGSPAQVPKDDTLSEEAREEMERARRRVRERMLGGAR